MSLDHAHDAANLTTQGGSAGRAWLRALEMTARIVKEPTRVLPSVIDDIAEQSGERSALLSTSSCLSFRALAEQSNRYARWALGEGLAKGDTICLLMPNQTEYLAVWLGVTRVGVVVSLLNSNLVGPSLAHCVDIAEPKRIIVAVELIGVFATAIRHLKTKAEIWVQGTPNGDFRSLDCEIAKNSPERLAKSELRPLTIEDRAILIYTSGTTGMPKAAHVSHFRLMYWSHWFAGMMNIRAEDRMYNCLPMYHSVGGVVATGAMLVSGGSVVIKDKFSARQFWSDVVSWECTVFQYIGELCRYLLRAPVHPDESKHRIRVCCGNGLRPDVWDDFKARFRIPQILEFYASTEGNVSMFNCEGKPGSVGRIPTFLGHRFPAALVKFDFESQMPVRNEAGYCIRCGVNKVGELMGKIPQHTSLLGGRFEGYTSKEQTEGKILREVFQPGDAWFRTGDLMRRDEKGFYYFVDRIGDTFRWKGENVSTLEVSEAITSFRGILEANVYGVCIPGTDGRAGMAAIVAENELDFAEFREHLCKLLPEYARPLFLRLRQEMELTPTFKQKKHDLALQGYDPTTTSDAIFVNDPERQTFVRLDEALYHRILSGDMRL